MFNNVLEIKTLCSRGDLNSGSLHTTALRLEVKKTVETAL
jgi:hypothetical protein